jgi:hypothetical protein
MKYAIEIGSGAIICIPSFMKTVSVIQKLIGGKNTQTPRHADNMVIS